MHYATAVIVPASVGKGELDDYLYGALPYFDEGNWYGEGLLPEDECVAPLFDWVNIHDDGRFAFPSGSREVTVRDFLADFDSMCGCVYYLIDGDSHEFVCSDGYLFPNELPEIGTADWCDQVEALMAPRRAAFPDKAKSMLEARAGDKLVMVDFHC